jgi:DUF4097 and DUF4098 domain-containing protein YvlB
MNQMTNAALLAGTLAVAVTMAADRGSFTRTYTVSGTADIQILTGAGSITVKRGSGSTVEVKGTLHGDSSYAGTSDAEIAELLQNPPLVQEGNTIRTVKPKNPEVLRHLGIAYEVTAPANSKVLARSGAGTITVEGIAGPLDANSGAGDVHVSQVTADVQVNTGAGKVVLDGLQGKVVANTGAGAIDGRQLSGEVRVRTGSGSVNLQHGGAARLEAHSGVGSVRVQLPQQAAFELAARSGMGKVSVAPAFAVVGHVSKADVRGTVKGGGPLVDLSTGMGSISVE